MKRVTHPRRKHNHCNQFWISVGGKSLYRLLDPDAGTPASATTDQSSRSLCLALRLSIQQCPLGLPDPNLIHVWGRHNTTNNGINYLVTNIVLHTSCRSFDQVLSMGRSSSKESLPGDACGCCATEKIDSDVRSHIGDASAKLAATIRSLRSLLDVGRIVSRPEWCCSCSCCSSSATSTDLRRTDMSRSCWKTVQNFRRQVGQGFSWLPATAAES